MAGYPPSAFFKPNSKQGNHERHEKARNAKDLRVMQTSPAGVMPFVSCSLSFIKLRVFRGSLFLSWISNVASLGREMDDSRAFAWNGGAWGTAWGRRSPDGRNFAQARLRKVRTPSGNAPHESEGRVTRGTRTESAAERYRRWSARAQARVKWWSKSPPRIRVTGRHGKPHVVQDRTGKGLPARSFPGISRTLRKQGAPPRRGERNGRPASQGVDRIRLTGERHSLPAGGTGGARCR